MSRLVAILAALILAAPVALAQAPLGGGGGGGSGSGVSSATCTGTVSCAPSTGAVTFTGNGITQPGAADILGSDGTNFILNTLGTGFAYSSNVLNLTQVFHDDSGSGTAIVTADLSKTVLVGAHTYTLAQAGTTGFATGWGTCLLATSGPATVNATTSTFNGASGSTSLTLNAGDWACPASDGTNYNTPTGHWTQPAGANPTATAGAAAVNGSATTFMRSDGAPALQAASTSTAGIAKLHNVPVSVGWVAGVNPNNATIAVINQASTISAIIGDVETATGGTATVSVYIAPSGTPCSGGTVLHSGSFNANGTAATNQTLTLTTTAVPAGDRICLQTTGTTTWTSGSGIGGITVFLAPS